MLIEYVIYVLVQRDMLSINTAHNSYHSASYYVIVFLCIPTLHTIFVDTTIVTKSFRFYSAHVYRYTHIQTNTYTYTCALINKSIEQPNLFLLLLLFLPSTSVSNLFYSLGLFSLSLPHSQLFSPIHVQYLKHKNQYNSKTANNNNNNNHKIE